MYLENPSGRGLCSIKVSRECRRAGGLEKSCGGETEVTQDVGRIVYGEAQ